MAVLSPQWANAGGGRMENICIAANSQQDRLQGVDGLQDILLFQQQQSPIKPLKKQNLTHFVFKIRAEMSTPQDKI